MSEKFATLTVIVPNYNKSAYLTQCIESIESQSRVPDEVIIVDDCSTDTSAGIIKALAQRYENVKPFFKKKNSGVSSTRNQGLALTHTEYVTFIDADDYYYDRDKLKKELALEQLHGGDIIAYSVTAVMPADSAKPKNRLKRPGYYLHGSVHFALLIMWKWDSVMRDYIIRTDTLREAGGYNACHSLYEDWELLLVLSREHDFYCTGSFGTAYREGNGLSSGSAAVHERVRDEIFSAETEQCGRLYRFSAVLCRQLLKCCRKVKDAAHVLHVLRKVKD